MSATFPLFDSLFSGKPAPKGRLTGEDLRNSGFESVLANTPDDWKQKLINRVTGFPVGYRFTIDRVVDDLGGRPSEIHPNSIGAITFSMVKKGLIRRTGVMKKAERASLHRTDMPEWIRL